jgi:hypothetical protein
MADQIPPSREHLKELPPDLPGTHIPPIPPASDRPPSSPVSQISPEPPPSGEHIRQATSESVREGADIRSKVHDITLFALQRHRFDRQGIRDVVRAVTEGLAQGAEKGRTDIRQVLSEGLKGLDQAIVKSAEASHTALKQLVTSSKDFSDNEIKQALANFRKLEDDFLSTVSQVADAANAKVQPELRAALHSVRQNGTETGRRVASTMGDFAQRFSAASLDAALTGIEVAGELATRLAALASGILGGVADALTAPRPEKNNKPQPPR